MKSSVSELGLKCSRPRKFAIHEKKKANSQGLARGEGGWAQVELTDA